LPNTQNSFIPINIDVLGEANKKQVCRVDSKGELCIPKEFIEKLGLHARTRVIFKIESGRLIVEPVPSLKEVLQKKTAVEIRLEKFHKFRKEFSKKAET